MHRQKKSELCLIVINTRNHCSSNGIKQKNIIKNKIIIQMYNNYNNMSIRQKKRRFVIRALVITIFMAVFSQFGQAQNVTNITETDKNSENHPNTMIFNHFQVRKANDSSSKGMFQRSENSGKNIEGLRDTKTDIMFAKGFANYTNNGYSSAGTDRTAVANSTNATSVTYAMQVYNGS